VFSYGCGGENAKKVVVNSSNKTVAKGNEIKKSNSEVDVNNEQDLEEKVKEIIGDSKAEVYNANDHIVDKESVILVQVGNDKIILQDYEDEIGKYPEKLKQKVTPENILSRMIDVDIFLNEVNKEKFYNNKSFKQNISSVKRTLIAKEYSDSRYNKIFSKLNISDSLIEKYYMNHKNDFSIPTQYHVYQILISGNNKESYEKALKIRKMIKNNNFSDIARKYSDDDATKQNGGEMGYFTSDSLLPVLSDFVKKSKTGDISDPINSKLGYHILFIADIKNNNLKKMDDVKEQIANILMRGKANQRFELWKKQSSQDIKDNIYTKRLDMEKIPANTIVAEVGTKKITYGELNNQIKNLPGIVQNAYKKKDEKIRLLRKMIEDEKLYQLAIKNKFDKSDEMMDKLSSLKRNILVKSYIDEKIRTNVLENKEFRDLFLKKLSHQVHVYHIFVKCPKNASDEEKNKALKKITEISKRVKNESDFKKVASEVNEDATKSRSGDLGYIRYGQMVPSFEKAAFSLKKGEISDIVRSRFGYHLILATDIRDKKIKDDDKMYNNAMIQSFYSKWIKNLRNKYSIKIFKENIPKQNG